MTAPALSRPPGIRTPRPGRRKPGRRTRHPLHAEARSGPARWSALAVSLILLVPLTVTSASWQGSWGQTQLQLHTMAVMLGGPLAAAAGCWQGGRERRSRMAELRAAGARGPLAQFLAAALPVVLGVLVGTGTPPCRDGDPGETPAE
ncbi:hypothetical protein [Streptomyces halobius]|uniref:Uncharacterized protein n=1 Tax=Streptomyces halobius TaxID=2879846 RepID=A0ABY4MCQ8_9ACTN|nr:hypothetical protein [Streptomyces halobius]UQA94141.1 hypothetical protein K9S39_21705 [Streptomyces halobius]